MEARGGSGRVPEGFELEVEEAIERLQARSELPREAQPVLGETQPALGETQPACREVQPARREAQRTRHHAEAIQERIRHMALQSYSEELERGEAISAGGSSAPQTGAAPAQIPMAWDGRYAPVAGERRDRRWVAGVVAGSAGALVVALAAVAAVSAAMRGDAERAAPSPDPAAPIAAPAPKPPAPAAAPASPEAKAVTPVPPAAAPAEAAGAAAPGAPQASAAQPSRARGSAARRPHLARAGALEPSPGEGGSGDPETAADEFDREFGTGSAAAGAEKSRRTVYVPPAIPELPKQVGDGEILQVVLAHKAAVAQCVQSYAGERTGGEKRRVTLRWTVATDGRPTGVAVETPELRGSPLGDCLADQISGWTFPRHTAPQPPIRFPFAY